MSRPPTPASPSSSSCSSSRSSSCSSSSSPPCSSSDSPTKETARDCLRLFVEDQFQQCYDLACSLVGGDDDDSDDVLVGNCNNSKSNSNSDSDKHKHADAGAFAHMVLAFLYLSYPKLFVHRQPFPTNMWTMLLRRAAECDLRCQEWMVKLLNSECARNPLEKVRVFCHFFLAMVLDGFYGKFPFTSEEKSGSNCTIAAQGGDPRALTAIGGFDNLKHAASLGYCPAQRDLGVMYLKGKNNKQGDDAKAPLDETEGMKLLMIAAEKGDPLAQVEVACKLQKKHTSEAVRLFKLAAPQGFLDADIHLAQVYLTGPEHLLNVTEALRIMSMAESVFTNKWMKQGKEAGSAIQERRYPAEMWASGFSTLAKAYWDGIGVKKDVKEAARLLHLSLQAAMHHDAVENTHKLALAMGLGKLYDEEYHDGREQMKWMKLCLDSNT